MYVYPLNSSISVYTDRPKRIKLFLQPWAGKKLARSVYRKSVQPVFESAGVDMSYVGQ